MEEDALGYKLVVIGGSAGSLEVILKIIPELNPDTNAVFVLVIHRKNDPDSLLENLVTTRTPMNVKEVEDKESIKPNTIYIAPPDYHLLLEDQSNFSLDYAEKVQYSRPSIDVTFESVAEVFGKQAIGILLSGANADGAAGLRKIKEAGGYTIVQTPQTAEVDYMPIQAINLDAHTIQLRKEEMAGAINRLLIR